MKSEDTSGSVPEKSVTVMAAAGCDCLCARSDLPKARSTGSGGAGGGRWASRTGSRSPNELEPFVSSQRNESQASGIHLTAGRSSIPTPPCLLPSARSWHSPRHRRPSHRQPPQAPSRWCGGGGGGAGAGAGHVVAWGDWACGQPCPSQCAYSWGLCEGLTWSR